MQKMLCSNLKIKSSSNSSSSSNDENNGVFDGYASVYHEIDSQQDIILPGTFKDCLGRPESIKLLWQHDASTPIGIFTKMRETGNGIHVEGKIITSTTKGKETFELIKAGAVDGLSIGFEILECHFEGKNRHITKGKLWEISIVTFPANGKARINHVKSSTFKNLVEDIDKAIILLETMQHASRHGGRY